MIEGGEIFIYGGTLGAQSGHDAPRSSAAARPAHL